MALYYAGYAKQEEVHPLYEKMAWFWRYWQIHYLGGVDHINPDIPIVYQYANRYKGDTEGSQTKVMFETRDDLGSFLFPYPREEDAEYYMRRIRSSRINLCAPIVDLYAGQVFSKPIVRVAGQASSLEQIIWPDVTLTGMGVDEFMLQGLVGAQVFGHMFAVVDVSSNMGAEVRSLADERDLSIRPYATWFDPLHVTDWAVDQRGRFMFVSVIEDDPRYQRMTPSDPQECEYVTRTWYPDHWEMRGSGDQMPCPYCGARDVIGAGVNPVGRVPVEVLYRKKRPGELNPIGISILSEIARLDQEVFNLMSQRQQLAYEQGFPFLAIPDPGGALQSISVGATRAVTYNPAEGGSPPTYVAPSTENARAIEDLISLIISLIRASSGLSRGEADKSIASRSAEALLIETNDKAAMLKQLAGEAEDFEKRLADLFGDYLNQNTEATTIRYPDRYDVLRLGDNLEEIEKLFSLGVVGEVKAEALKMAQARLLSHLPPDRLAELQDMTEEAAKEKGADTKTELLTPTDLATVVTVNEARLQVGLDVLRTPDGAEDPLGKLTVAAFRALKESEAAQVGEAVGTEKGAEVTGSEPGAGGTAETLADDKPQADDAAQDTKESGVITDDAEEEEKGEEQVDEEKEDDADSA